MVCFKCENTCAYRLPFSASSPIAAHCLAFFSSLVSFQLSSLVKRTITSARKWVLILIRQDFERHRCSELGYAKVLGNIWEMVGQRMLHRGVSESGGSNVENWWVPLVKLESTVHSGANGVMFTISTLLCKYNCGLTNNSIETRIDLGTIGTTETIRPPHGQNLKNKLP